MTKIKESDLYLPIKGFFIENDYNVNGEVKDVDMVISKDDNYIAVELKTAFNLKLILQAVERQKYFESVYVAIEKPKYNKHYREMLHLLKRLELGLITVSFLRQGPVVTIEHHPIPLVRKANYKKQKQVITEIKNRSGVVDNIGGSTRVKKMTAYREASLLTALALSRYKQSSPKVLKALTGVEKTGQLLYQNYYGWFDRIDKGVYMITKKGLQALSEQPLIIEHFHNIILEREIKHETNQ